AVLTVEFIVRPGPDTHAVGLRAIDQLQRELGLRAKLDIVRDVLFFGAPDRWPTADNTPRT
ncbi:MAG: hypothetical protein ACKV2Q_01035, partial [Planctomycetaceae bacterium]